MANNKIDPKNVSAQLQYRARGNPPATQPVTAISNCFPGLEFDFRNIWRRIFVGLVLHEARPLVVDIEDPQLEGFRGQLLVSVEGEDIWTQVSGPQVSGGPVQNLSGSSLEWANALASIVERGGNEVRCGFYDRNSQQVTEVNLQVRRIFEQEGVPDGESAVLAASLAQPGELTQSLCSPWQNDYRECACYYWAASRPDFVNSEEENGVTQGQNWLHKDRGPDTPKTYSLRNADLVSYEDLFRDWEQLRFIIRGQDEDEPQD
ncbi:MAG TPA: hypothetical protein VLV83_04365 [Acidobacteriota bacterium]|nr:hypothetical protein [Acidobacteriota bacterium]